MVLALVIIALASAQASTGAHNPPPRPSELHSFMRACEQGQTFGIDSRTYVCRPAR